MDHSKKLSTSDDEDDLEALRLAALRTIKKKNAALNGCLQSQQSPQRSPDKHNRFNRSNKRGRFFGPHQGRNGKNAQFNRSRNPNLISIQTLASEEEKIQEKAPSNDVTVNLPQHRYCSNAKEEKREEETSKFNRYNKSDESESESEEEEEVVSGDDSPGKLHKADSLEALMQELDDEIQGKTKVKENLPVKSDKPKVKKIKKKKRADRVSTSDSDAKPSESVVEKLESDANVLVINHTETDKGNSESETKDEKMEEKPSEEVVVENKPASTEKLSPARKRPRSRSPMNRRGFVNRRRQRNFLKFENPPLQNIPFVPPLAPYPPPVLPFSNPPFNPLFAPPNVHIMSQPPPFFERPLSPLAINAESLTTATLAPLSPRSAAFVLENKAIIERRKRSPRRSYSRSRSPSRSPRRSLTPRRSISPRRISRSPRRMSRSPRRRSLSPRRRSLSPKRRNVGRSRDNSPKSRAPIRERLGVKNKNEEVKEKPKETRSSPNKEEKPLDPILEARRRKFESNEIKKREGIIRLKPKEEKIEEKIQENVAPMTVVPEKDTASKSLEENSTTCPVKVEKEEKATEIDVVEELENLLKEDALLEGVEIEINPKVADIFSDEDSTSDNEGRFKVKEPSSTKPPVPSFTKLVNGEKTKIKSELLPTSKRNERRNRDRRDRPSRSHDRPRSPIVKKDASKENVKGQEEKKIIPKKDSQEKLYTKPRVSLRTDRHVTPMERRFERKIEIKIKNPSKYERGSGKSKGKEREEKSREEVKRKVELGDKEVVEEEEEEEEPEIVVENNSGDEENTVISEGDLRAQLSKKRAEKLHRIPVEGVSSRLLQNALQGAVFKKTKKKSKEQDISSSEGKLPIHLRLGIANATDIFAADAAPSKPKRKRKRKNREALEQV